MNLIINAVINRFAVAAATERGGSIMHEFPQNVTRPDDEELTLDESRLLVAFVRPTEREEAAEIIHEFDLQLEDEDENRSSTGGPGGQVNHSETRYWVRSLDASSEDVAADLEEHEEIDWVAPVYKKRGMDGPQSRLAVIPDVLLVRYEDGVEHREDASAEAASHLTDAYDLEEVTEESALLGPFHYYRLSDETINGTASYTLFEDVEEERRISEVHLESMPMITPLTAAPELSPSRTVEEGTDTASETLDGEPTTHVQTIRSSGTSGT